ncbi:cation:proton antiporter, partial [Beggiatoa alba]|nr:cation:proton antiporter [Beggiatoa alba]
METQTGVLVLLFVVAALLIGAATRYLLKHSALPYTVVLLVIGLALGLGYRAEVYQGMPLVAHTIELVADIDPHLVLLIFLPILIFDSAFAMETHLFRRMFTQIALLAVPGLIVATVLSAAFA